MQHDHKHKFASVILAAGNGTRMRSSLPKVMHKIAGVPMIGHVIAALAPLSCEKTVVVVAPHMDEVAAVAKGCEIAVQKEQRGTGHAVLAAESALAGYDGMVFVLYGDTPLLTSRTLHHLIHVSEQADVVVLGMELSNPTGYGRLIIQEEGHLHSIVEDKDATPQEKAITLCNSGVMAISGKHLFALLKQIQPNNAAGEYYLTDIVSLANKAGLRCVAMEADAAELSGVNSRSQLADAETLIQMRLRWRAMEQGATLVAPETVYLRMDTKIGQDVVIHPHVVFGDGVSIADNVEIRSFSHIDGARIEKGAMVGPFARIRPGSVIGEEAMVGNFVELKKTTLGKGAKASHLSYIGDTQVGEGANIGAGTITCNYDGTNKYNTVIGAGAFIGSNTSLVAPVTIGDGAVVGAGSVITEDVEADALAIARAPQVNKAGRAKAKK